MFLSLLKLNIVTRYLTHFYKKSVFMASRPNVLLRNPSSEESNLRIAWSVKLNVGTYKKTNISSTVFRYDLEIKIPVIFWNKKQKRAKQVGDFARGKSINSQLDKIIKRLQDHYDDCLAREYYPTKDDLRQFLNKETHRISPNAKKVKASEGKDYKSIKNQLEEIWLLIRRRKTDEDIQLIERKKQKVFRSLKNIDLLKLSFKDQFSAWIIILLYKNDITISAAHTYFNRLVTLLSFQESNKKLNIDTVDLGVFQEFLSWAHYVKDYGQNTISLTVTVLSSFIKWSYHEGLTDNRIWEHPDFVASPFEPETIALAEEEIWRVIDFDFSAIETEITKKSLLLGQKWFAIFFLQGIRFSDNSRIDRSNIITRKGELYFDVRMQKTQRKNRKAVIPCHWRTLEILDENDGRPPKIYRHDSLAKIFRELCFWAGINRIVEVTEMKRNTIISKKVPAWQAVSIHTGRRSYATMLYNQGIAIESIRVFLGHASVDQTIKYLKISDWDIADRAVKTGFFSKSD